MSDNLPPEMIKLILLRLPPKPLLRFRSVSKPWLSLIDSPTFISHHLHLSTTSHSNSTILVQSSPTTLFHVDLDSSFSRLPLGSNPHYFSNSCHGLVLLVYNANDIVLWNPTTRLPTRPLPMELFQLPDVTYMQENFALGYSSKHHDYRVVRVVQAYTARINGICLHSEVKVFSLKSNSWTAIDNFPYVLPSCNMWGAYLNDALITLVESGGKIMAFDLSREVHYEIPKRVEWGGRLVGVEVMGGCVTCVVSGEMNTSEIWVMKEYGVKGSWFKLLCFDPPAARPCKELWSLGYSKGGGEVLLNYEGKRLYWYDLRGKSVTTARLEGVSVSFDAPPIYPMFFPRFCVASLVSPYAPGGEGEGSGNEEGAGGGSGKDGEGVKKKRL